MYPVSLPNWTTQAIVGLISAGCLIIAFFISFYHYNRKKYRPFLFLTLGPFLTIFMSLLYAFSVLFLSIPLIRASVYTFIPIGFFNILLLDSMSRETVDPVKILALGMISVALLFVSLDPSSFYINMFPNGEWRIYLGDNFLIVASPFFILIGTLYVYYAAKIYRDAPKELKIQALVFLLGGIITGFLSPGSLAIRLNDIIPAIHMILFAIGVLISSNTLASQPKLAYILPFKVLRLAIINTNSGVPLYTHIWEGSERTEDMIDPMLFSGMMHTISQFVQESLKKGNVTEIHLEEAILILERSEQFPIVCVLISTKSSQILRQNLNYFAKRFFEEFSQYFSDMSNLSNFATASDLVLEYFPFVPEYD
ncbi:MAG: hypothetical protein HWN67_07885 [Candidatus Helarchaeota archaeon]|nr:hypothetical protein [Candidatus Helarchaeota archaeon]